MRTKQFLAIIMSAALALSSVCPAFAADASESDLAKNDAVEVESAAEISAAEAASVKQADAEPAQSEEETSSQQDEEPVGSAENASEGERFSESSEADEEADEAETADKADESAAEAETADKADESAAEAGETEDLHAAEESDGSLEAEEPDDPQATDEPDAPANEMDETDDATAPADQNDDPIQEGTRSGETPDHIEGAREAEITEAAGQVSEAAGKAAGGKTAELTGVKLNRHTLTIKLGESARLSASAEPETAVRGDFIWETGDSDIATVDQSGKVTTVGIGTTTIYVYSENYKYHDTCELKVTKINLSGASVLRISGSRPYTGGKIQPVPVVKLGGVTLQEGRDYKVNYSRNTNVGTATCIITGQNNYSGSVKRTFEIVKAPNRFIKIATGGITLPLSLIGPGPLNLTLSSKARFDAKMAYELISVPADARKYITLSSGGSLSLKKGIKAGTYKIKIRVNAAETKNSRKASGTKEIKIVLKNHMRQYSSLPALGVKGYSQDVDRKVNATFDEMIVNLNGQNIKYASLSDYDKAYIITLYIGSKYYYKDGSYNAESMLDKGYGTCFAYSDLTYLMAKKAGLSDSWLTVPGRNVDHNGKYYGSQHRSVVTKIGKDYYELDSNGVANMLKFMAAGYPVNLTPEKISESYARYLIGKSSSFKTIN